MIKRNELANPSSCLNKAADDEPVFVLRANDPLAPDIVRLWVERYERLKDRNITAVQSAKCSEAQSLAYEMESWRSGKHVNE